MAVISGILNAISVSEMAFLIIKTIQICRRRSRVTNVNRLFCKPLGIQVRPENYNYATEIGLELGLNKCLNVIKYEYITC